MWVFPGAPTRRAWPRKERFFASHEGGDVDESMAEEDDGDGVGGVSSTDELEAESVALGDLPNDVFAAAHTGDGQALRAFLADPRGDVNARDRHMRGTLLMAAVATQQLELIELLLLAGASVHVTDAFGCTAISSASCPLDHQPIRFKLARGAAPTASRQVCDLLRS